MTLVFDRREELGDRPGTHALLCGISAYPHLPDGDGEPTRFDFGRRQLDAPVRTVCAIRDWLTGHADQLAAPLATLRLLVAPGPNEQAAVGETDVERPTLDAFLREAAAWRTDASAHPDGLTIFYISGHGFMVTRADQLVLLHDYGDGLGSILRNTINVASLSQGMAPTSWNPRIARTQLYFVDTGQAFETLPLELAGSTATQVFDLPAEPGTDRVSITFSPAPGAMAVGLRGGLSFFGRALLECLDGLGAEQGIDGNWGVTTLGLAKALPEVARRLTAEYDVSLEVTAGGLIGPAEVVRLPGAPEADLAVGVPAEASQSAVLKVHDSTLATVEERGPGLDAQMNFTLPAGLYVLELKEPDRDPTLETVSLMPSHTTHVELEPAT
jgi:hypothetical protein